MTHQYETINILDLIENVGEDEVKNALSDFSCGALNDAVEYFLKGNAINFTRQHLSVTHLVLDEQAQIQGFFTLTHKPLAVKRADIESFSNTLKKRLYKHAKFDEATQTYELSAFLIAQFGKNYQLRDAISGNALMKLAIDTLRIAQHVVGGGVIFLECEDSDKLLQFYQNESNGYKRYSERRSEQDEKHYIRLLRFF